MTQSRTNTIPVVIYQMGKVGSTALLQSIEQHYTPVYQVHSLVSERLEKTTQVLLSNGLGIPKHVKHSQFLVDKYLNSAKSLKIITPIRSPLKRNISAFFQGLSTEIILKDDLRKGLGLSPLIKTIGQIPIPNEWKNQLIELLVSPRLDRHINFLMTHFTTQFRHDIPLNWLDIELNKSIGLDVYSESFNQSKGYGIYKVGPHQVLLFKSELSNTIKTKLVSEFIGINISEIKAQHRSVSKSYGKSMQLFRSKLKLEPALLDRYRNSKYVQTFYGDEQLV